MILESPRRNTCRLAYASPFVSSGARIPNWSSAGHGFARHAPPSLLPAENLLYLRRSSRSLSIRPSYPVNAPRPVNLGLGEATKSVYAHHLRAIPCGAPNDQIEAHKDLPGNTFQHARLPCEHQASLTASERLPWAQARALARFRRGKRVVALTLGFLFTVGLPIGLKTLVFSDRSGRDDEANRPGER